MSLESFSRPLNVAVVGASGGIGSSFVRFFAGMPSVESVVALSRTPTVVEHERITRIALDLTDEYSIEQAVDSAESKAPFDLVVIASGILHEGSGLQPEKTLKDMSYRSMVSVFAVNTIGPAILSARILPLLRRDRKSVLALLSARVGSIADNRLGGWTSYRASKAALNMVVRTYAIEHARRNPASAIIALHPGTVATDLSAPFSKRVPPEKLFDADDAVRKMIDVIDGVDATDSGGFFAWDGSRIEF
jgi:NAD(P)-dependent dehydrogenase (short-subunit alcohol dehydrogenase family)